jgi:glutamate synthase (NADPH/NADH) small chain
MGKATGFIEYTRSLPILADAKSRVQTWDEFHAHLPVDELKKQGARCMNCGIPFCHTGTILDSATTGCPLNNLIPEWNDLVYRGQWHEAYKRLALTNNFPEFTGRVCPAPCEFSCVLGINEEPVNIKEIEVSIIDKAFREGWISPNTPKERNGKRVAIIGSGPAGLACADELNKHGFSVMVFERDDRIGGLLMYGIPNMKLDKKLVERRVKFLSDEGIEFKTSVKVGEDITAEELKIDFDAIVLACGSTVPRDLLIEGRDSKDVHFAMEFLLRNTKSLLDSKFADKEFIDVKDKNVIVIGGGDTGTDCVATSIRHGCKSINQFELLPKPIEKVHTHESWLAKARTFQIDYGQEEAKAIFGNDPREYCILSKRFVVDEKGNLTGVETVEVEWQDGLLYEIAGTEKVWAAEKVFLAMGFIGAEKAKLFNDLGVEITSRGTIAVNDNKQTNVENVFAAGDCERGQSLVVWAIADGRKAAEGVKEYFKL